MDQDHTILLLLDNLKLTLDNIVTCKQNYKFLPEYHKYFELDTFIKDIPNSSKGDLSVGSKISKGTLLQAVDNLYMKLSVHQNSLLGNLGNCIIDQFVKAEIMTRTKTKIGKKKHLNVIKVEYNDLTIFYGREFPRISIIIENLALR